MENEFDANKRKIFRSLAFWSWNGEMNESEIIYQINDFYLKGYGGFFIHSRAGLEIAYMGDAWFEACKIAIREAKNLGLTVWIYDEDGWPSGFAGGIVNSFGEDYQIKRMESKWMHDGDVIPEKSIVGYRIDENSTPTRYLQTQLKHAELIVYFVADPHYVDLLNPKVTEAFIKSTHEVYRKHLGQHFGSTIKGCFIDEPQLNNHGYTWSVTLPEYYEKTTGRNLLDELWMLFVSTPQSDAMRHDYWKTIGLLYKKSFTEKTSSWCIENGIELTGHFACEDGLCDQIPSNGGVMQMYPLMQLPGIDHLGKRLASPVLMKQVSSIAEQYGKERILSESFGCTGWNLSFSEMLWIWGYQVALGINLPCLHLSAYTIKGLRKRDYPAFFSYQEPWWKQFKIVNDAFSGLSTLLSQGESDHHVLVVSPLSGMWMNLKRPGYSQEEKMISSQYRQLVENLLYTQIGFDIGDESLIQKDGEVINNKFKLGKKLYDYVFVSQTSTTLLETAKLYEKFLNSSGKLIFVNQTPALIDGRESKFFRKEIFNRACLIQNRKDLVRKYFDYQHFKRSITFASQWEDTICNDVIVRVRNYSDYKIAYVWNRNDDSTKKLTGRVEGGNEIKQLDPKKENILDGKLKQSYFDGECTSFDIELPPKTASLFSLTPKEKDSSNNNKNLLKIIERANIIDWIVSRKDLNALTVDYAAYSINNSEFSEYMPVLHMQEEIYSKLAKLEKSASVSVKYDFNVATGTILKLLNISLVAESEKCKDIIVNGTSILKNEPEWWIDHSMKEYPIGEFTSHGMNTVEIIYQIPEWRQNIKLGKVFETEKNRFYYPIGFEAIYLRGNFSVCAIGLINEKHNYWSIEGAKFEIANAPSNYSFGEYTSQDLWFYRGDIELVAKRIFPKKIKNEKYYLEWEDQRFVMSEVSVNGVKIESLISAPYRCDISDSLIFGKQNEIKITLMGSNRNLLGPHHHIKGEPRFVGPNTFLGKKGYEDFVNVDVIEESTWTPNYNFVKTFIVGDIWIVKEETAYE